MIFFQNSESFCSVCMFVALDEHTNLVTRVSICSPGSVDIGSPEHLQHCMLAGEAVCKQRWCWLQQGTEGTEEEILPFSQCICNDLLIETPKFWLIWHFWELFLQRTWCNCQCFIKMSPYQWHLVTANIVLSVVQNDLILCRDLILA